MNMSLEMCKYFIKGDYMNRADTREKISRGTGILVAIGIISAIMSLFVYPFIFGFIGVIMGILSTKNGSRTGLFVIVASIILMGIGLIFSGAIMNNARHYLGI
ncbi:hypothetical protein Clocl_4058 [Acetivibrio clariflavus DSM 19732]|uniref:DUF4190 domain-containing protein n=2 Tax=Acetivibrio clariflavus TaxID=288965 RepID=G8LSY1_ACECE|nr:hypothetical protein Clocl_4058 [Acetivibrio clariflavus DSM 19732]